MNLKDLFYETDNEIDVYYNVAKTMIHWLSPENDRNYGAYSLMTKFPVYNLF